MDTKMASVLLFFYTLDFPRYVEIPNHALDLSTLLAAMFGPPL